MPLTAWSRPPQAEEISFLALTARTDTTGAVRIFYGEHNRFSAYRSLLWTMAPTEHRLTYRFALPTAGRIDELRFHIEPRSTLTLLALTIEDAEGRVSRTLPLSELVGERGVTVRTSAEGCELIAGASASGVPFASLHLTPPLLPGPPQAAASRLFASIAYLFVVIGTALGALRLLSAEAHAWSTLRLATLALLLAVIFHRGEIRATLADWAATIANHSPTSSR